MDANQGYRTGTTEGNAPDPVRRWKRSLKKALKKTTPGRLHRLRQSCRQIEALLLLDDLKPFPVKRKRGRRLARAILKASGALRNLDVTTRILRTEGIDAGQPRRREKRADEVRDILLKLKPRVSGWIRRWEKIRASVPASPIVSAHGLTTIDRDIAGLIDQLRRDLARFSPHDPASFAAAHHTRILLKRRYYQRVLSSAPAGGADAARPGHRERREQAIKDILSLTGRIHDRLIVAKRLAKIPLAQAERRRIQTHNAAAIDALLGELHGRLLETPPLTATAARLRVVS